MISSSSDYLLVGGTEMSRRQIGAFAKSEPRNEATREKLGRGCGCRDETDMLVVSAPLRYLSFPRKNATLWPGIRESKGGRIIFLLSHARSFA